VVHIRCTRVDTFRTWSSDALPRRSYKFSFKRTWTYAPSKKKLNRPEATGILKGPDGREVRTTLFERHMAFMRVQHTAYE
jgi:hypothetical protein